MKILYHGHIDFYHLKVEMYFNLETYCSHSKKKKKLKLKNKKLKKIKIKKSINQSINQSIMSNLQVLAICKIFWIKVCHKQNKVDLHFFHK